MGPVYVEVCECTRDLLLAHGSVSTAIFFFEQVKVRVKQLNAARKEKKSFFKFAPLRESCYFCLSCLARALVAEVKNF